MTTSHKSNRTTGHYSRYSHMFFVNAFHGNRRNKLNTIQFAFYFFPVVSPCLHERIADAFIFALISFLFSSFFSIRCSMRAHQNIHFIYAKNDEQCSLNMDLRTNVRTKLKKTSVLRNASY